MRYPVASPDLSGNESRYVNECLNSTWISSKGPFLQRFEESLRNYVGVKHAIATCNGTAALHLAYLALGLGPGDEVIVPTLTFVATINAVLYCGAIPVFADSDPVTWGIAADSVKRLITPRTRAIVAVHLFGQPCDMNPLRDLADKHDLWLIEDAAEALGAGYRGRQVGSLGDVSIFSFFGNKIVTTGEGGMVLTNSPLLAEKVRLKCHQGMDPECRYWHTTLGYNYRMTNVAAAIGLAQLERIDEFLARRRELAKLYQDRLHGQRELTLPAEIPDVAHSHWMYGLLLPDPGCRGLVMERLASVGIETRPFFYPAHTFPMYRHCLSDEDCPVAGDLAARGICLPTSTLMNEDDVECISRQFIEALPTARAA